ncbi:Glutathione S-transferase Mu 2 [Portunus trituberculatus]|uniref:Glutathione S-transferase Mu 2 n=1 Tax=Portunus trituberculatus TaxID=210409 RepID=A0A5B7CH48_PORTR|nr:Glutathione S-transferase Mu 2 [Portunus trituberculatus]
MYETSARCVDFPFLALLHGPPSLHFYLPPSRYHPVRRQNHTRSTFLLPLSGRNLASCPARLLAPLIIISIFLGIIAFSSVGLVPSFNLPPINIPELEINRGSRSLVSSAAEFLPWRTLNNMTEAVLAAVEGEECRPWLVCESGRLAEGRTTALSLMELLAPRKYQQEVRIFKDSALLRTSCDKYKCSSFKKPARWVAGANFSRQGDISSLNTGSRSLTFADFLIYEFLDQHRVVFPSCLDATPPLQRFMTRFESLESIREYMAGPTFMTAPLFSKYSAYEIEQRAKKMT